MHKVLIVNDSRLFCRKLTAIVQELGYESVIAMNGQEAVEILGKVTPKYILLDIIMPVMDGIEFLRAGAAQKLGVPVIVVSSDPDSPERKQLLRDLGASGVMLITADKAEMQSQLAKLLSAA